MAAAAAIWVVGAVWAETTGGAAATVVLGRGVRSTAAIVVDILHAGIMDVDMAAAIMAEAGIIAMPITVAGITTGIMAEIMGDITEAITTGIRTTATEIMTIRAYF